MFIYQSQFVSLNFYLQFKVLFLGSSWQTLGHNQRRKVILKALLVGYTNAHHRGHTRRLSEAGSV